MIRLLLAFCLIGSHSLLLLVDTCCAQTEPQVINLWPASPPGPTANTNGIESDQTKSSDKLIAGKRIIKLGNVGIPQMHVYLPGKEHANGGAVLVCPGGGFSILAWDLEGTEVASWLNSLGFAAVVVKYRVPTREYGEVLNDTGIASLVVLGPLMDAQRAMCITRARALEWNIDPQRIGIMGFSAGGATAGLSALLGNTLAYDQVDAEDDVPCAPKFALLIYPGGLVDKESGALKPYIKVTKDSPPMFFVMAQDDRINCENCTTLFTALKRASVPAELHVFTRGGHGYGLRSTELPVTRWPILAAAWLKEMGFTNVATASP